MEGEGASRAPPLFSVPTTEEAAVARAAGDRTTRCDVRVAAEAAVAIARRHTREVAAEALLVHNAAEAAVTVVARRAVLAATRTGAPEAAETTTPPWLERLEFGVADVTPRAKEAATPAVEVRDRRGLGRAKWEGGPAEGAGLVYPVPARGLGRAKQKCGPAEGLTRCIPCFFPGVLHARKSHFNDPAPPTAPESVFAPLQLAEPEDALPEPLEAPL